MSDLTVVRNDAKLSSRAGLDIVVDLLIRHPYIKYAIGSSLGNIRRGGLQSHWERD